MGHAGYASLYFQELGDRNKELDTCAEFHLLVTIHNHR